MTPIPLFQAYGIEIESMIVQAGTLDVRPLAAEALREAAGANEWVEDFDDGPIGWSNELVAHVLELKTAGPAPSFEGLAHAFGDSARRMTALLRERHDARLMPTGMHPWMDPTRDTVLWPHDHGPVYRAYDRLFGCRRHGWANLQSVHLNLPFAGDEEFARLHAAVRAVLPLVPALAASSPFVEGRATGLLDSRLEVYRTNSARVPAMTGEVIPEPVWDPQAYRELVLEPIDRELRAIGAPEELLGREWTNARGAIARFDRMAIELRLIDAQECPRADLAVAFALATLVRSLVEERTSSTAAQRALPSSDLVHALGPAIAQGPAAPLPPTLARVLGAKAHSTMGAFWRSFLEPGHDAPAELDAPLETILRQGTLAQRILDATGPAPARARLVETYTHLCEVYEAGEVFRG